MKRNYPVVFFLTLSLALFINACTEDSYKVSPKPASLNIDLEAWDARGLGRIIFYDTKLSLNNSISCASCHKQSNAFSDNVALSKGFDNQLTVRNSIPIQNLFSSASFFGPSLFWDGREQSLLEMVLQPLINHVEMGMGDVDAVVERMRNTSYYPDLFQTVYGSREINKQGIQAALEAFVRSINSQNSKLMQSENNSNLLNALELQGKNLFFDKFNCDGCHNTDISMGYGGGGGSIFSNIGLDLIYNDPGRQNSTGLQTDNGKFRVPDLSNVGVTAPYMHDGRFQTLDEVLDHYSHSIQPHVNLDLKLKDQSGQPIQMNISNQEKVAIIAFLETLTDHSVLVNPDFSNPFK
ncbi:MAG TPA: cytochrome c peroxidase [Bacteroidia bacterium]|nr:cytochrome c peroxidase [Bacteroidia bacterium]